jgi:nucleoside-diphosphate-sugar epimerase
VEEVIIGDLASAIGLSREVAGMDVVVHAAGRAHITRPERDSLEQFRRVNVAGSLNLARQAAAAGVKRFVFVSSIGVNGVRTVDAPFTADDEPAPLSAYAISKHEAEVGLRQIALETGLDVVIVRPPLVIGPRAPGNFGLLMRLVYMGVPLPFGSVANRRSFVGIDNLVDFITTCVDHPAARQQTFLVSDNEDLSTPELLREVGQCLGKPVRLWPVPLWLLRGVAGVLRRADLIDRLCGSLCIDISKSRRVLGWIPPNSPYEGIRRAAAGFISDSSSNK